MGHKKHNKSYKHKHKQNKHEQNENSKINWPIQKNKCSRIKYFTRGSICLSALIVWEVQYVLINEHQNNCNVHVFLMLHTRNTFFSEKQTHKKNIETTKN